MPEGIALVRDEISETGRGARPERGRPEVAPIPEEIMAGKPLASEDGKIPEGATAGTIVPVGSNPDGTTPEVLIIPGAGSTPEGTMPEGATPEGPVDGTMPDGATPDMPNEGT